MLVDDAAQGSHLVRRLAELQELVADIQNGKYAVRVHERHPIIHEFSECYDLSKKIENQEAQDRCLAIIAAALENEMGQIHAQLDEMGLSGHRGRKLKRWHWM